MKILETKNLKKYYNKGENEVKAVDNINISINKGEFVMIVGESGSGKSTLLHMIGGLDNPTSGEVIINGKNINKLSFDELAVFRRRNIGFIFQSFNLVPVLSVYENIVLPTRLEGEEIDEEFVEEIILNLGLHSKKDSLPNELSGGQQQRVAVARALASKPAIILADEPTGNLDSKNTDEVITLLKSCAKRYHQTILIITHDNRIALQGDKIIKIEDGKVIE